MGTQTTLSGLLLTAALGAGSAAHASDQIKDSMLLLPANKAKAAHMTTPIEAITQGAIITRITPLKDENKTVISGGQGGNAVSDNSGNSVSTSVSTTIDTRPRKEPEIRNEYRHLGACSGSTYQALWQTVKMASVFEKNAVYGLVGTTKNSFTIRQYQTESDQHREDTAAFLNWKINPPAPEPVSAAGDSRTNVKTGTGGNGGNGTGGQGGNATYTIPDYYKHVTFQCTLGN